MNKAILAILCGLAAFLLFTKRGQNTSSAIATNATSAAETIIDAGSAVLSNMSRGERNNNPGNIHKGPSAWVGMLPADQQSDASFVRFDSAENGIRALAVLLRNYYRAGFTTVATIIGKYAPPNENATFSYAKAVASALGVNTNTPLDLNNRDVLFRLIKAIINHENGRVMYSDAQITTGIGRA